MEQYVVLNKEVGETPLSAAEAFRATRPDLKDIPLSYAGRLDPMASGKLLVLIGEECKHQSEYHDLDKEYEFSVLFGITSDTQDVLGRLRALSDVVFASPTTPTPPSANTTSRAPEDSDQDSESVKPGLAALSALEERLIRVAREFVGPLTVPYPLFSAKTVQGKPLHMWTLERRLDEIEIPTRTSHIYELELINMISMFRQEIVKHALEKIETIPPVTDERKALGNDFRRVDVRNDWKAIATSESLPHEYHIATFRCVASSGSYMRTLATLIAEKLGTIGLAWHIHRTKIGTYDQTTGAWKFEY